MKKKVYILLACFLLLSPGTIADAAANHAHSAHSAESRVIAYPSGYDVSSEGASSYNGIGNVKKSPYYPAVDFYHAKPTDSLVILPKYKTYQQTTEISCGPAAALTVLTHYGDTKWEEKEIAKIMGTKPAIGTDTTGMARFFKAIGWDVKSSLASPAKDGATFATVNEFKDFVVAHLKDNTPIMVENIDWGGHWRVIIGYDDLGTPALADDVLILADSYDTADHLQDGYVVNPVEKFYYMWFDAHMLPQNQQNQQWLTARPPH
jgi:hypothetical protein